MLEFFVLAVQNKQPEVLQMQRPWTHLAEPTDGGGPACLICLEPRDTLKNSSVVTRQTTAQNPQKTDMSGNVR